MAADLVQSLEGLPYYIAYFGSALLIYTVVLAAYVAVLPIPEFALLRERNAAAALSLAGAMIGFALPLASVLHASGSMTDLLLWSVATLAVQLGVVAILRRMLPALSRQVVAGDVSGGLFLGAFAVAVGLLNAASIVL
jgi:putative membrane protein